MRRGVLALIGATALLLGGCTVNKAASTHAVAAYGMHDITLGGYSLFGCDAKDAFSRTFEATASNGMRVRGVICKGWFKGATVRVTG